MTKFNLSDYDKTILLIVSLLAMLVGGTASVLDFFGIIPDSVAVTAELMALSWWFGAVMTFTYDRVKKRMGRS